MINREQSCVYTVYIYYIYIYIQFGISKIFNVFKEVMLIKAAFI